ncbi:MAG: universal stress protein [Thermoleophilia bacterium]
MADLFERVVCAVDGSEQSLAAIPALERLLPAGRRLQLVCAVEPDVVFAPGGGAAGATAAEAATRAVSRALARVAPGRDVAARPLVGPPVETVLATLGELDATLVAFAASERGRLVGILTGAFGSALLHRAPTAVLALRPPAVLASFPASIACGVDGSPASLRGLDAALELQGRSHAALQVVAVADGRVDPAALRVDLAFEFPFVEVVAAEGHPARALAAARADLLVVGSRGLTGLLALGSVSERVAHEAQTSVLVVR